MRSDAAHERLFHRRPRPGSRFFIGVALATAVTAGYIPTSAAAPAGRPALQVKVLSNRADLISGGDALVEVVLPEGTDPEKVTVKDDKRDVTSAFDVRPDGRYIGLLTGLDLGPNVLRAKAPGTEPGEVTITNFPNEGPVFSGPQLQPWTCQDRAVDAGCNQPAEFSFAYKSSNPLEAGLKPYDPDSPPGDVAMTTTDEGVTVPFIVRMETGYQDRDQYKIATLFQPGKPWAPWAPQEQWNKKVLMTHGHGCGVAYGAGEANNVSESGGIPVVGSFLPVHVPADDSAPTALARGFAVMSTALNNNVHNCNITVAAESMMMAKEHLVERYGEIRYTIGIGCSGGSVTSQTVANAYPGIYQGIIVSCSYPDTASPGAQFFDYHLMRKYFEDPARWGSGVVWTPAQWAAVEGHLLPVNAITADEGLFKSAADPTTKCPGISDHQRYHPKTNPSGVRCDVFAILENQFGLRGQDVWSENEKKLGRGFTARPFGNTGVQFGLEALRSGAITPEMFVDLNSKLGGLDIDSVAQVERTVADQPALQRMYRTGWLNTASNLDQVAIIDHGGPEPAIAHDARWAWVVRDRLDREHGRHDNHVIWFGQVPAIGDPNYFTEALVAMDRWLASVEADDRNVPVADKIVQDRPGDLQDRCSQVSALSSPDGINPPLLGPWLREYFGPTLGPILFALHQGSEPVLDPALRLVVDPALDAVCGAGIVGETLRTDFDTPRGVAGQSNTSDDHECQLKPMNRDDDYGVSGLTDAQWANLEKIFPDGVCDYSKPGVGTTETVPWLTFQDCHGQAIYGGEPLGSAPAGSAAGWNSRAFDGWQDTGMQGDLGLCPPKTSSPENQSGEAASQAQSSTAAEGSDLAATSNSASITTGRRLPATGGRTAGAAIAVLGAFGLATLYLRRRVETSA